MQSRWLCLCLQGWALSITILHISGKCMSSTALPKTSTVIKDYTMVQINFGGATRTLILLTKSRTEKIVTGAVEMDGYWQHWQEHLNYCQRMMLITGNTCRILKTCLLRFFHYKGEMDSGM